MSDIKTDPADAGIPRVPSIKDFPAAGRADASTTAHGWAAIPRPSAETVYAGLAALILIACVLGWWWTRARTREAIQAIERRPGKDS